MQSEQHNQNQTGQNQDDSNFYLKFLDERQKIERQKVPGVQTVLVVFSARSMAYDTSALKALIAFAYPGAKIFFESTSGQAYESEKAKKVDLLIDFTGPGHMQGLFYARNLRARSKFAVGRNAGLFRKRIFDRVIDEKDSSLGVPKDLMDRECWVQKQVLALAGVATVPIAHATEDLGKKIALNLPPLQKR